MAAQTLLGARENVRDPSHALSEARRCGHFHRMYVPAVPLKCVTCGGKPGATTDCPFKATLGGRRDLPCPGSVVQVTECLTFLRCCGWLREPLQRLRGWPAVREGGLLARCCERRATWVATCPLPRLCCAGHRVPDIPALLQLASRAAAAPAGVAGDAIVDAAMEGMCGKFHWCQTCTQLFGGLSKAGSHESDWCLLMCDRQCFADIGPICKEDDCLNFAVYEGYCIRHGVIWEKLLNDPNFVGSKSKVAPRPSRDRGSGPKHRTTFALQL